LSGIGNIIRSDKAAAPQWQKWREEGDKSDKAASQRWQKWQEESDKSDKKRVTKVTRRLCRSGKSDNSDRSGRGRNQGIRRIE